MIDAVDKCRSRLISFARAVKPSYKFPWHLQKLMGILERVERGELTRVMIEFPPRHGKSETSSVLFPSWFAGRNPDKEIMLVSGTKLLATRFGLKCRNIINSPQYKCIFPDTILDTSSHAKSDFSFAKGGAALFSGIGGQITGRGAHLFVIDDLIPGREEADSEAFMETAKSWYQEECYNRLMSDDVAPHGRLVVIGTRWRENDLHGWLLDPEEQDKVEDWHIFRFPALAEEDEEFRKEGDALWPDKISHATLLDIREKQPRMFAGAYQQQPSIESGNVVQREWLNVEKIDESQLIAPRIMALDTAFKEGAENDYSAAVVAQRTKNGVAILYAEHRKLTYPALLKWVEALVKIYGIQGLLIEDKASGQSLIQTLRQHSRIPVIPIQIKRNEDKESRLHAICPYLESKRVILHKWSPANTREDLIKELLQFPFSAHDDLTDAFVHAITYLIRPGLSLKRMIGRSTADVPVIYGR